MTDPAAYWYKPAHHAAEALPPRPEQNRAIPPDPPLIATCDACNHGRICVRNEAQNVATRYGGVAGWPLWQKPAATTATMTV